MVRAILTLFIARTPNLTTAHPTSATWVIVYGNGKLYPSSLQQRWPSKPLPLSFSLFLFWARARLCHLAVPSHMISQLSFNCKCRQTNKRTQSLIYSTLHFSHRWKKKKKKPTLFQLSNCWGRVVLQSFTEQTPVTDAFISQTANNSLAMALTIPPNYLSNDVTWEAFPIFFSFIIVPAPTYSPLCTFFFLGPGQPASELLERSLSADATSVTLESLLPDTEYVISLYPLFPRNSASPSILNARTREFTLWFMKKKPMLCWIMIQLSICNYDGINNHVWVMM